MVLRVAFLPVRLEEYPVGLENNIEMAGSDPTEPFSGVLGRVLYGVEDQGEISSVLMADPGDENRVVFFGPGEISELPVHTDAEILTGIFQSLGRKETGIPLATEKILPTLNDPPDIGVGFSKAKAGAKGVENEPTGTAGRTVQGMRSLKTASQRKKQVERAEVEQSKVGNARPSPESETCQRLLDAAETLSPQQSSPVRETAALFFATPSEKISPLVGSQSDEQPARWNVQSELYDRMISPIPEEFYSSGSPGVVSEPSQIRNVHLLDAKDKNPPYRLNPSEADRVRRDRDDQPKEIVDFVPDRERGFLAARGQKGNADGDSRPETARVLFPGPAVTVIWRKEEVPHEGEPVGSEINFLEKPRRPDASAFLKKEQDGHGIEFDPIDPIRVPSQVLTQDQNPFERVTKEDDHSQTEKLDIVFIETKPMPDGVPVSSTAENRRAYVNVTPLIGQLTGEILTSLERNRQRTVIQLDPPALGRVQISILAQSDRVEVRIVPENQEAGDLIQRHLTELREYLQAQSIGLSGVQEDPGSTDEPSKPFVVDRGMRDDAISQRVSDVARLRPGQHPDGESSASLSSEKPYEASRAFVESLPTLQPDALRQQSEATEPMTPLVRERTSSGVATHVRASSEEPASWPFNQLGGSGSVVAEIESARWKSPRSFAFPPGVADAFHRHSGDEAEAGLSTASETSRIPAGATEALKPPRYEGDLGREKRSRGLNFDEIEPRRLARSQQPALGRDLSEQADYGFVAVRERGPNVHAELVQIGARALFVNMEVAGTGSEPQSQVEGEREQSEDLHFFSPGTGALPNATEKRKAVGETLDALHEVLAQEPKTAVINGELRISVNERVNPIIGRIVPSEISYAASSPRAEPPPTYVNVTPVIGQLAGEIRTSVEKNRQEAVLQLEPPEMGRVQIKIVIESDRVEARIMSDTLETRDLIQRHLPELRESLQAQSVSLGEVRVDVGPWGGGTGGKNLQKDPAGAEAGQSARSVRQKERGKLRRSTPTSDRAAVNLWA
ncbi:MAG: flagellar hook-length control protein FliK [Deltaproteobacteria bacterium]|nr:flagellar hook-length control protein FliK [Deltaproteobacteria bacterium]